MYSKTLISDSIVNSLHEGFESQIRRDVETALIHIVLTLYGVDMRNMLIFGFLTDLPSILFNNIRDIYWCKYFFILRHFSIAYPALFSR